MVQFGQILSVLHPLENWKAGQNRRQKRSRGILVELEYLELEFSNDLAENAMRPVALGRRNWIHVGKQRGRTASRRHHFDRRNLSPPELAAPRLPQLCAKLGPRLQLVDDPAEGCLVSGTETVKTSAEYLVNRFGPFVSGFDTGRRDRQPVAAQVTFFPLPP